MVSWESVGGQKMIVTRNKSLHWLYQYPWCWTMMMMMMMMMTMTMTMTVTVMVMVMVMMMRRRRMMMMMMLLLWLSLSLSLSLLSLSLSLLLSLLLLLLFGGGRLWLQGCVSISNSSHMHESCQWVGLVSYIGEQWQVDVKILTSIFDMHLHLYADVFITCLDANIPDLHIFFVHFIMHTCNHHFIKIYR